MIIRKSPLYVLVSALLILSVPFGIPHYSAFPAPGDKGISRNVIIVNQTGTGDYTHIQWAIDNASDGDTIYVEAGIYHENITVCGKTIELLGEDNSTTFIKADDNKTCIILSSSLIFLPK